MSDPIAPRLHRHGPPIRAWAVICLATFALSFVLGMVWFERRTVQEGWIPTSSFHVATYP